MNKQKFIEFLKNPGELKEQNLTELDDLVDENPYFQAARALEAKGNRLLKTRVAGKKTAAAAVYSTNRILLKKYLKGDGFVEKTVTTAKPVEVSPTATTQTRIQVTQETSESTEIISSPGSSSIDQLIYSLQQDMKELEKSRARYIEVTRKIEEEEAVEKAVQKATGTTRSPRSSSGTKKGTASSPKSSDSTRTSTAKKSTSSTKSGTTKKTTSRKTSTTKAPAKKTSSKAKSRATKKTSTAKKTTPKKSTTKKTTTRSAAKSSPKKSSARTSRTTRTRTTKSSKKEDGEGEKQRELIDQFIKNNPSFKPANEPKNAEDLSEESTSLPEDIGSEYLAEIFLGQGKKDHAIKIYNSLILRFPEKKAYFAGRIKKIK